ncbi:glycosyltransferase family 4 protein [Domibacillus indicus]|uniref:glycosyltransferase family 4 protein n=1 Tax=Domibacillus indicus TaxID=1437523 RepID=UPI00203D7BC8|nr:glycosyltransferase family 4 protein [Domibacillus indicus]MCM3790365.1 glycosyltransferase family 4 protein [Domibacillus indicus]
MSKSVLFITTISRTVQAFLIPHICYFLEQGYRVGIATNTEDEPLDHLTEMGVTVHYVPFNRKVLCRKNWRAFKRIKKVSKDYDILHLHTPVASFLARMAASRQHRILYMVHGFHFHEGGRSWTNWIYILAERAAGWRPQTVVVTNRDDLKAARRLLPNNKIHYVHGVGVDTEQFKKRVPSKEETRKQKVALGIAKHVRVLTHIAELNENKRQFDVIDACALMRKERDDFMVLLVGSGEREEMIRQYIRSRQLDDHIKCLGFRSDIPDLLAITDIGLLVSIREGLPRSIMEMMASQIPVVATDIRGNRDLVENEETGFLVPVQTPEAIAEKCLFLLENKQLARQLGVKGREKIEAYFSLPAVLKEMEAIYKELNNER